VKVKIYFDITRPIFEQSITAFQLIQDGPYYRMNPSVGDGGTIRQQLFPGDLEFYHYGRTVYQVPIEMKSVNTPDSDWFLLHVNLSSVEQKKRVGKEEIEFHKYRPAGILLYGPGLEIETFFPRGTQAEVCGLRFSRQLLQDYFTDELTGIDLDRPLVYEDLDPELEFKLMDALGTMTNKAESHSRVLDFLNAFIKKLRKHAPTGNPEKLLSADYRNLLQVSALLRDPAGSNIPTLEELAEQAGMSITKLKVTFKQVFGCAPKQYHTKIRLEYAREQLRKRRKTPVELSHELGYSHPSNFTSAYKKYFKVLPSAEPG